MYETTVPARRMRRSRDEWQTLIEDFKRSGVDAEQYCRQHQLSRERFRLWQRRLDSTVVDGLFVEVQREEPASGQWTIELTLGDLCLKLQR